MLRMLLTHQSGNIFISFVPVHSKTYRNNKLNMNKQTCSFQIDLLFPIKHLISNQNPNEAFDFNDHILPNMLSSYLFTKIKIQIIFFLFAMEVVKSCSFNG